MYKYISFEKNGKSFLKDVVTLEEIFDEIAYLTDFCKRYNIDFYFGRNQENGRIRFEFENGERIIFIPIK